ncbi:MAG: hypothetical protein GX237_00105 [Clostridiales bacterium]|nr:hypothetical protein [Clostridiales bacterium]
MRKRRKEKNFDSIIDNKKIPILTLDSRWHELFPEEKKSDSIKKLEQNVNNLLKLQGKLVNDIKDMKVLKKSLVNDIVANMDINNDALGKAKEKKLEKNKRFITELNDKIDMASEELSELPYKIREANEELLSESIRDCYERISINKEELIRITNWIADTREELKAKILSKHDMETTNNMIYSYMHDILGAEIIDLFDDGFNKD